MRTVRWVCGALMLATIVGGAAGCGEGQASPTSSSGADGGDGSGSSSSGTGGSTSSGTGGAGTGGNMPIVPACRNTCITAADCATPGGIMDEPENWACTDGACDYRGCNSAAECVDAYQDPHYVCSPIPGYAGNSCNRMCTKAADCATPGDSSLDLDNWACLAGECDYKGCNSTEECIEVTQNPNYVCSLIPGETIKNCYTACSTVVDCVVPGNTLFDLDNWACTGGICDYKGCSSTKECTDDAQKPNYVCK